jgi:hypothetical protein
MPKYKVELLRSESRYETAEVFVDASSVEEAKVKAIDRAYDTDAEIENPLPWRDTQNAERHGTEAVSVKLVEEVVEHPPHR